MQVSIFRCTAREWNARNAPIGKLPDSTAPPHAESCSTHGNRGSIPGHAGGPALVLRVGTPATATPRERSSLRAAAAARVTGYWRRGEPSPIFRGDGLRCPAAAAPRRAASLRRRQDMPAAGGGAGGFLPGG